jgi:Asp-tRNA(Asn)/Glu-tRNA(Gln) amidotransferase A subunit family amidase
VDACLHRIDERDGEIQAWAYVAREEARLEAVRLREELKARGPRGPLHGIPFGVKDIYDTAGMPTEWGSPLFRGRIPREDAEIVAQLRRAGAIVLGKTHTTAFAYYDPAPTRNPHNLAHTPGGSSSGSAAAIADGMVPFALGSQTQGSVLRPASFCGIVGLKPTFGRLPRGGILPFAPSLDHPGFFTRTVEEMSFLWSALAGSSGETAAPVRLAFIPWPPDGGLEREMETALRLCCERLRSNGVFVELVDLPKSFAALPDATRTVMKFEAGRLHGDLFRKHGVAMGAKLARLLEEGLAIEERDCQAALQRIEVARADFARVSEEHPIWLTPAAPGPAPGGLASTGDPRCNLPFTAIGVPALALPFGRSEKGLPLGLQLAAPAGREDLLLAAGQACERVLGFSGN